MSYELRISDPARHSSLPTDHRDAADILERLQPLSDTGNAKLQAFGNTLVERYLADKSGLVEPGGLEPSGATIRVRAPRGVRRRSTRCH